MTEERKRELERKLENITEELKAVSKELGYTISLMTHDDGTRFIGAHMYDGCVIRGNESWTGLLDTSFEEAWESLDKEEAKMAREKWFGGKE